MKYILETTMFPNQGVRIFFSFLAMFVTLGLILLVVKLIKINRNKYLDSIDSITSGALSRVDMKESVQRYLSQLGKFGTASLIYIDLDNFAGTNELLGKETSDRILVEIANRILRILPNRVSLCRYKEDKFLIFIKDEYDREDLSAMSQDLRVTISEPLQILHDDTIKVTASLGIVTYPTCGETFKELMQNIELATYVSKRQGGNQATIYYAELGAEESENLKYFKEVKQAMDNKEFLLYYQPIINLYNDDIYAFEGLLRWNHPVHGVLSPFKFLNILEQSGDIVWVGQWALENIIKTQKELDKLYPNNKINLSINLSSRELVDENLAESFINIANLHKADTSKIILEMSEYNLYEHVSQTKMNILRLRDYGFKIAVDGFALDYQALSTLERSPIDIVKLDKEFVADLSSNFLKEKFTEMLSEFASKNEKIVISEGVENEEMVKYLSTHKIHFAQGYFYSKAVGEHEAMDLIKYRPWSIKTETSESFFKELEPQQAQVETKEDEEVIEDEDKNS